MPFDCSCIINHQTLYLIAYACSRACPSTLAQTKPVACATYARSPSTSPRCGTEVAGRGTSTCDTGLAYTSHPCPPSPMTTTPGRRGCDRRVGASRGAGGACFCATWPSEIHLSPRRGVCLPSNAPHLGSILWWARPVSDLAASTTTRWWCTIRHRPFPRISLCTLCVSECLTRLRVREYIGSSAINDTIATIATVGTFNLFRCSSRTD